MKRIIIMLFALCLFCTSCKSQNHTSNKDNSPSNEQNVIETAAPNSESDTPGEKTVNESPLPTVSPVAEGAPLSKTFIDIIKSNDYFMRAEVSGATGVSNFSVSVSPAGTAMDTEADGKHYNTVIKDNITYMIDHQSKMIITSSAEVAPSASNMAGDRFKTEGIQYEKTDKGDFSGQDCIFDSYILPSGGIMRFYMKDQTLLGIECDENGTLTKYYVHTLSAGHHPDMHEIPAAYQLVDLASIGG